MAAHLVPHPAISRSVLGRLSRRSARLQRLGRGRSHFGDIFSDAVDWASDASRSVNAAVQKWNPLDMQQYQPIGDALVSGGKFVVDGIISVFSATGEFLLGLAGDLGDAIGEAIDQIAPTWLSNAIKCAGRLFSSALGVIVDALGAIKEGLSQIPIVGGGLSALFDVGTTVIAAAQAVAGGERIDKAVLGALDRAMQDVKAVAPYAESVLSLIPGVGTLASGALAAGLSLASGQPIDEALLSAVEAAIPGGPLAKAAFNLGKSVLSGQSLDKAALSALVSVAGVQLGDVELEAISGSVTIIQKVAKGERVDHAVADVAFQTIQAHLGGASAALGLQSGLALGQGAALQAVANVNIHTPQFLNKLVSKGSEIIASDSTASAALSTVGDLGKHGFQVGIGAMSNQLGANSLMSLRDALGDADKKAFELACSLRIGQVMVPSKEVATLLAQFSAAEEGKGAYYVAASGQIVDTRKPSLSQKAATPHLNQVNIAAFKASFYVAHGIRGLHGQQKAAHIAGHIRTRLGRAGAVAGIKRVERSKFRRFAERVGEGVAAAAVVGIAVHYGRKALGP